MMMSETPSKFQVWLHPGRAIELIESLQLELSTASEQAARSTEDCQSLEQTVRRLKAEHSTLQASNTEVSLKYKKLMEQHEALNREVEEIRALVEKVSVMKQSYEQRIEKYKAKISDLKRALEREEAAAMSDITPINQIVVPKKEPPEEKPPTPAEPDSAADWYLPLDL